MIPTPQDIAIALTKAGCDRLPAPALAYIGGRMGRSDLTRLNLGGLRPISYGCAKSAGIGDAGPIKDSRWSYYRIVDDERGTGAHWIRGFDVATNDKESLSNADSLIRAKFADEPPNSVLVFRIWNNGSSAGDPVVVKDNFEPGKRPESARRFGIGDAGEPFDPVLIRGTVDDTEEFEDLDAAARALVSVAYRAAPRAWGQVGEAELATLGSYPIHRAKVGAAKAVDDLGESIDALKTAVDGLASDIGAVDSWTYVKADVEGDGEEEVIAEGIRDADRHDAYLRIKLAEDIKAGCVYIYRMNGPLGSAKAERVVINSCGKDWEARLPRVFAGAVGATPSPIPGLPSVQDTLAAAQQVLSQVAPQATASVDMGSRKVYPSGISPEMESTMRALVADWEGFDRLGVGTKVLPDLRPAVEQFRKLRDAWKAGSNDPAVVSQEIDAATKAASQVREALAKAGVIDPALGPAAIKATQDAILAAQQAAAASSKSWLDNVPALKWLSNPNGPTVRVTTDPIVPAEWRAPIVVGVAGLAIVGAWFALSSRKASRSAARSG